MEDCVLITLSTAGGYATRIYLEPYDATLFNKLDLLCDREEFEHWQIDYDYLSLEYEIHNVKIIMIRALYTDGSYCSREILRKES